MKQQRTEEVAALIPDVVALWDEGNGLTISAIAVRLSLAWATIASVLRTHPGITNRPKSMRATRMARVAQLRQET